MKQDETYSFELLDEQKPRADKRFGSLPPEQLAGVLLLLAVAGWAGWDWWQQQSALSNYRVAARYATARDWDAARTAFLAAGDFADAKARAADAAKQIRDRNAIFAAAAAEIRAGNWAAALRDFRRVQEIEPGFRDSTSLAQQAQQQVYMLALSGTVALRVPAAPAAGPDGLYLYMANGWNYLPGSDASSQVRSDSESACLVYDTPFPPAPSVVPAPTQAAGVPPIDLGIALSGRRLMVAQYGGGTLTTRPLAFDLFEFPWFICDGTGVMGKSYPTGGSYLDLRLAYARGIQLYSPGYQTYDSPSITRISLPGPAWAILADDSRKRLVVGDYTNVLGYDPQTRLYVSDPHGRLLLAAERQAIVQAAWLSPDGHYLLSDEFIPMGDGPEEHRLVLLTTDQSRLPEVLMSTKRRNHLVVGNAWYDAAFIDSGAFAGKLLIERKTYPDGELRLIDPDNPARTVWTTDQINYADWLHVFGLSDGMLFPLSRMSSNSLSALYVAAGGKTTPLALPVRYGDTLAAAKEIDGRLVCVLVNPGVGDGVLSTVHSIAWPDKATGDGTTIELLSSANAPIDIVQNQEVYSPAGQRWSLGPGMLAYTQQGQLRAKTYDGTISLLLEEEVLWLHQLRR